MRLPQHSISRMRDRDIESVQESDFLKVVLYRQHEQIRKRSYPVIKSNPEKAIEDLYRYIEEQDAVFDVVLFDLPGTLRSEGVVHTISAIDYIFIPLKADNVVMQSSLQFAEVVEEELIARHNCNLKGIYLSGTWSTSVNGQKATSPGTASYKKRSYACWSHGYRIPNAITRS